MKLILKDWRLYREGGVFGELIFVNYEWNLRFYPGATVECRD
jgi:hypothetical protein